jgi:hypothetical protein
MQKSLVVGQPHDLQIQRLTELTIPAKQDMVIFQHRLSPEKQVNIFRDLQGSLPHLKFVICQERPQSKDAYHRQILPAKIALTTALQESYGISICLEAPLFKILPFAPNRLSYAEIFKDYPDFLYPSEWSESWEAYQTHKAELVALLNKRLSNYSNLVPAIERYCAETLPRYGTGQAMIANLIR